MRLTSAPAVRNLINSQCYHAVRMAPDNEMPTPEDHWHSIRPWLRILPGICIARAHVNICVRERVTIARLARLSRLWHACKLFTVCCAAVCSVSCPGTCYLQMTASIKRNPALADLLAMTAWQHSCTSTITRVRLNLPHPQLSDCRLAQQKLVCY